MYNSKKNNQVSFLFECPVEGTVVWFIVKELTAFDTRNPAHQLRLVVYLIIYRFLSMWLFGFLNHQQYFDSTSFTKRCIFGGSYRGVPHSLSSTSFLKNIWRKFGQCWESYTEMYKYIYIYCLHTYHTSWWFQPIWKICSSNWESSPILGVKIKNIETST